MILSLCKQFCRFKHNFPVTHCIFDFDGIIVDTETVYGKVIDEILQEHGHCLQLNLRKKILGRTTEDVWKVLIKELNLKIECEHLINDFVRRSHDKVANCPLLPGVEKLLLHLNKHKIPIAVATSSSQDEYQHKAKPHQQLLAVLNHAVCGGSDSDVKESKPHPDIFLICANRFSDRPQAKNCLVFEDSVNGVIAAVRAGMQCIAIPDKITPKEIFEDATLILRSMEEFQPEHFGLPSYKSNK